MRKFLPPVLCFIFSALTLEFLVGQDFLSETLVPPPSVVLQALWELRGDFSEAFLETLLNVLGGLTLSLLIGNSLAVLFSLSDLLKRAILPFAVFFQTVPIIAIAPLLVIYFGFGAPTVIASSFIVSLFPMIANTLMGLESASELQKDLFRVYKAHPLQVLLKLKIPVSYRYAYAGLKVSAGLAIIGAIAGEFVAGGGLGALVDTARTQQRVDLVFGALLLLSLMGLLFLVLLGLMNFLINRKIPLSKTH